MPKDCNHSILTFVENSDIKTHIQSSYLLCSPPLPPTLWQVQGHLPQEMPAGLVVFHQFSDELVALQQLSG